MIKTHKNGIFSTSIHPPASLNNNLPNNPFLREHDPPVRLKSSRRPSQQEILVHRPQKIPHLRREHRSFPTLKSTSETTKHVRS